MNEKPLGNIKSTKLFVGIFFLMHYGLFHAVYASFLFFFSSTELLSKYKVDSNFILLSSLIFFINYLGEFIFIIKKENNDIQSLPKVMSAPYKRVIPMHLTIIFSGFAMFGGVFSNLDISTLILIIFMGIKTITDLLTHS